MTDRFFFAVVLWSFHWQSVASFLAKKFPKKSVLKHEIQRPVLSPWQRNDNHVLFLASSRDENDNEFNHDNEMQTPPLSPEVPLPEPPPFLSAAEASIRRAELELLADLLHSDAPIPALRLLWYGERGPDVEERLRVAWQGLGHPDYWPGAETTLRAVIEQEGPTYLFPFVLLSKLYFFQGKFEASQAVCERIYRIKPYQFSILENMVANCVAQGKLEEAERWQQKRLPTPESKEKREAWVKNAIEDALRVLEELKRKPQSNIFRSTAEEEEEEEEEGIIEDIPGENGDDPVSDPWQ